MCVCVCVQSVWEGVRRERGGDALNRFLATWEKLHSNSEATPIATPTNKPVSTRKEKKSSASKTETQGGQGGRGCHQTQGGQGNQGGRQTQGGQGDRGVQELNVTEEQTEDEEDDIVKDFNFSSDSDSD